MASKKHVEDLSRPALIAQAERDLKHATIRLDRAKSHTEESRVRYNEALSRLRELGVGGLEVLE